MARLSDSITYGNHAITGDVNVGGTLTIDGVVFSAVSITGGTNVSVSGTYPNFTISSTDTNTTYSAGTGLSLSGTQFNIDNPFNPAGSYTGLRAQATTKTDVGLSGIPNTNGSTVNYLRGDGSWVTPPNTNYYLSGLSFNTADGVLTATVNGATNQTVNLDGRYLNSSNNTFNNLLGKTSGGGDYSTTGNLESGRGSGGVALTINDSQGNANVTFNHANGVPEQTGNAARIEVNTDSTTSAAMNFELKSGVTGGASTALTPIMSLDESGMTINNGNIYIPSAIYHAGDTDTYMQFHGADQWRVVTGGAERFEILGAFSTFYHDLRVSGGVLDISSSIRHLGDTNNAITFGTDAQAFETAGIDRLTINNTAVTVTNRLDIPDGTVGSNATRDVTISTVDPTSGDGADGDIWYVYE